MLNETDLIMLYLLLGLLMLGLFCAVLGVISRRRGESQEITVGKGDCVSCSGDNAMCEQECTLKAAVSPIEYFDDEELDDYKGRPSDSYSDDEEAQFAEVLETLRPEDVKPWGRSLTLRGINLPDGIKDEYIMLASK